jgi:hypothetical protein
MCLRMRDAPTCIGYLQYFAIEERACLVDSQVSHMALERVKIQTFDEPCRLRPERKWQAAHRHEICNPYNSWRTYQRSSGTKNDASARYLLIVSAIRRCGYHCRQREIKIERKAGKDDIGFSVPRRALWWCSC